MRVRKVTAVAWVVVGLATVGGEETGPDLISPANLSYHESVMRLEIGYYAAIRKALESTTRIEIFRIRGERSAIKYSPVTPPAPVDEFRPTNATWSHRIQERAEIIDHEQIRRFIRETLPEHFSQPAPSPMPPELAFRCFKGRSVIFEGVISLSSRDTTVFLPDERKMRRGIDVDELRKILKATKLAPIDRRTHRLSLKESYNVFGVRLVLERSNRKESGRPDSWIIKIENHTDIAYEYQNANFARDLDLRLFDSEGKEFQKRGRGVIGGNRLILWPRTYRKFEFRLTDYFELAPNQVPTVLEGEFHMKHDGRVSSIPVRFSLDANNNS